jgi:hypothetical protein
MELIYIFVYIFETWFHFFILNLSKFFLTFDPFTYWSFFGYNF